VPWGFSTLIGEAGMAGYVIFASIKAISIPLDMVLPSIPTEPLGEALKCVFLHFQWNIELPMRWIRFRVI
jgi:uncharacterized membrane protein YagU involved in acid resistance